MTIRAIGIIGAMDEEIAYHQEQITDATSHEIHSYQFVSGKIGEKDIVLLRSGIG